MADLTESLEPYRNRKGIIKKRGGKEALQALFAHFEGDLFQAAEFLGYAAPEPLRRNWAAIGLKGVWTNPEGSNTYSEFVAAADPAAPSDLPDRLHALLLKHPKDTHTLLTLADEFDCSPKRIEAALADLSGGGFNISIGNRIELQREPLPQEPLRTGWADHKLRFGIMSDTHYENRFSCHEEIAGAYDFFAAEGITDVLIPGDLHDGPGERGYPGHRQEAREECQTARQCVRYVSENFPCRKGITTHFIESAKSHAGWEFAATGFDMGRSLAEGFSYTVPGPQGDELMHVPGRPDMHFLGHDDAPLLMGPEEKTKVRLYHPDGGSAYAWSYQLQKWAESIEGGNKPQACLFGHYHKFCHIRPRNIQVLSCETMCWQTPFMLRKRLEAHVGFILLEMTVETDGTIRSFMPWEFPFFLGERRTFDMAQKEVA